MPLHWLITYETRISGAIGSFEPRMALVRADNEPDALDYAADDLEKLGYETRFPLSIQSGEKADLAASYRESKSTPAATKQALRFLACEWQREVARDYKAATKAGLGPSARIFWQHEQSRDYQQAWHYLERLLQEPQPHEPQSC